MNELNCPNCGALITGDKCEYCGTVFRVRKKVYRVNYCDNASPEIIELIKNNPFLSLNEKRKMAGLPLIGTDEMDGLRIERR